MVLITNLMRGKVAPSFDVLDLWIYAHPLLPRGQPGVAEGQRDDWSINIASFRLLAIETWLTPVAPWREPPKAILMQTPASSWLLPQCLTREVGLGIKMDTKSTQATS